MSSDNDINLKRKLNAFEIQCITGNFIKNEVYIDPDIYRDSSDYELIQELDVLIKNIANHDYRTILGTEYKCLVPFKEVCKDFTLVFYEKCSQMKSNYQYLFHPNGENCPYVKQLILLFVGVAALQEFIRINISGPYVPCQTAYRICAEFLPDSHFSKDSILDALARDGEVILAKLSHPKLLYLSLILLFGNNFNKCLTHKWWLFRCLMIHQKCLPETIIGLHKSIISLISKQSRMDFLINKEEMLAEVMFYIECAQVHLYYSEINIAKRYLISAQNVLGIGIKFNVAFNKRTSSSKESFVLVKRNDERYKSDFSTSSCIYPTIHIQCDTANNDFDFIDQHGNKLVELSPEEQMVLLTYCDLFQCCEGCQLSNEDVIIIKTLLSQPKIWAFQVKALFQLCKKRKTAESLKFQIVEFFKLKEQENPPLSSRLNFIFCALPPLNFELYELLLDTIDDPEEGLSLCEQHHLWDKALAFYRTKTYMKRGIKTLEEHIAVKPSSLLWCYLGNICSKTEMYNVAWDLSRHTNARSQRYLGYHYTVDKKYHKSIDHYKQSLQVNPLQPKVLQIIGYNAMVHSNWDLAIEILKRILELDDCNYGAWNSLTQAHIKNGQKTDACRSFLEVKRKENLNMENYILLCSQIGAFRNVIGFYKSKIQSVTTGLSLNYIDVEVLDTLINAVITKVPGSSDLPYSVLRSNVNYLFERLVDVMLPDIKIWEMYCFYLCKTTDTRTNVKTLKTILSLRHKIISHSLKRLDLKSEKFESLLQCVIRYIDIAKTYVSISRPSESSKFQVIIKTKSLLDKFLHAVKDIQNQFELSRDVKESLSIIVEQTKDIFNWSRLSNMYPEDEELSESF